MEAVPRPQVGCGTGAFWPSGVVVTICTASGARQRSVKPSAHSGPGSRIFGPGPRPRPLRIPMPDHLSPVPACVRASRSLWFSPLGPGARCTVCPSWGPSDPCRRGGRVCLNRLPQAAGPRVRGGPTIQRPTGPNGQLPDGGLPGLLRSLGPHAAGSGTYPAVGLDARWRGRQRRAGPRHACTTRLQPARHMSEPALDASCPRPKYRATPSAPLAGTAPLAGERGLYRVPAGTATDGVRGL